MIGGLITEACFGGNVLTNWYEIKVVSVDGNVGVVDLKVAWRIFLSFQVRYYMILHDIT